MYELICADTWGIIADISVRSPERLSSLVIKPVISCHRSLFSQGTRGVLRRYSSRVAGGDVIGAGEVVVGKLREVEDVVVRIQPALPARCFIERIAYEKMWS